MSKSDKAEEEEEEDKAELGDNCLFTGALESDHDSEVKVYLIISIFYFRHFPTYNRWLWTDAWETTRQKWTSTASLFHAVLSILSSPRQPSCLSSFFIMFSGRHLHLEAGRRAYGMACEEQDRRHHEDRRRPFSKRPALEQTPPRGGFPFHIKDTVTIGHNLHRHGHHQVVTLETRVKYDQGLVEATGGQTEVELKINCLS